MACGSDSTKAKEEATKALTSGDWKMQSVSVDGTGQTTVYAGLAATFTDTGFSSTKGGLVWPASGTWSFKDDTAKSMERNDGIELTLVETTATKLVLKLTWQKQRSGPAEWLQWAGRIRLRLGIDRSFNLSWLN